MSTESDSPNKRDRLSDKSFNRVLMEIVGPILIILMVGSLVFFLIEVFYRGPHAMRLGWVLGLFTFAAVLVSRISIMEGLSRAAIFGLALAGATLMVTMTLVDFEYGAFFFLEPVVVIVLIAVVMWSANRLTWDCTVIDASRDVSSIGLSEVIKRKIFKRNKPKRKTSEVEEQNAESEEQDGFTRGLFLFFANSKTQNTPGLWVFYFAIAAFPIFGLGQLFAQPSEGWGYRWIFLLFAVYLGSGLGLLMLTSLLGLERYLRKRGAAMPSSVSRSWMTVGTLFALGVMSIVLLLPSPTLPNGLRDALAFFTTNSKETSKNAVGNDGQDEGDAPKGEKESEDGEGDKEKSGEKGKGDGGTGKGGDGKSDKKGDDSGDSKNKGEKNQNSKSPDKGDKKSENGEKSKEQNRDQQDQKNQNRDQQDQNQKNEKGSEQNDKNNDQKQPDQKQNDPNQDQNAEQQPKKDQADQAQKKRGGKQKQNANAKPPRQNNASAPSKLAQAIGGFMKYVVWIGGLIAVAVMLFLFRKELAKLWAELFGSKKKTETNADSGSAEIRKVAPKITYSQFNNPFKNGFAEKWPTSATLEYTFSALEAWARGGDVSREHDQTPHEFANALVAVQPDVANEAKHLADLLGHSLFSGEEVSRKALMRVQNVWALMDSHQPRMKKSPAEMTVVATTN